MADMIDGYSHYLFEDYIPRMKMDTYRQSFIAIRDLRQGSQESGKYSMSQIKSPLRRSNQCRLRTFELHQMGGVRLLRDLFQIMFLAPDFFEARADSQDKQPRAPGMLRFQEQALNN